MPGEFLGALRTIRSRTRERMERGRIGSCSPKAVLTLLDDALATENLCVLRHKRQSQLADGADAPAVAGELRKLVNRERAHAERIAARIVQLGGEPGWCPGTRYGRRHSDYFEEGSLEEMICEDVVAEQIAMDSYADIIGYIGDSDPVTRAILEEILLTEVRHAQDLVEFLPQSDSDSASASPQVGATVLPMRGRREH
jgi:bacterioferritin